MNEIVKQRSDEEAMFSGGYETWTRVRDERDMYKTQCESWERAHAIMQAENEMMRQRILDLEHKSSFYMRHSTELTANLHNCLEILQVSVEKAGEYVAGGLGLLSIKQILDATMQRAKDAAYRPTNAAPSRPQQQIPVEPQRSNGQTPDDGEPVPKFLTRGDTAGLDAVQQALTNGNPNEHDPLEELNKLTGKPEGDR